MSQGSTVKQRRPFSCWLYLLIVCGLSWPFQIVSAIWARDLLSVYVLNTTSMVMVAVSTWLCGRYVFRDGFAGAGWRWGKPWHYVAVISFAVFLWIVPTCIDLALREVHLPTHVASGQIAWVGVLLFVTLLPAFGEEFGWRGYLLPHLAHQMSARKAVFVQAVAWWAWHQPLVIGLSFVPAIASAKQTSFGGNLNDIQITYSQNGNTLNVVVHRSGRLNFFDSTSVDFTITVPPTTDLQITTHAGDIAVDGVSGKMSLRSLAGSIGATQASLTASSTFRTNAGGITFNGSLDTTGTYDFETNAGSIEMTLPDATTFHMNAATDVGTITTSFPVSVSHSGAGATAIGEVGAAPQATLTLRTTAGSISLKRSSQVSFSMPNQSRK